MVFFYQHQFYQSGLVSFNRPLLLSRFNLIKMTYPFIYPGTFFFVQGLGSPIHNTCQCFDFEWLLRVAPVQTFFVFYNLSWICFENVFGPSVFSLLLFIEMEVWGVCFCRGL